MSDSEAPFIRPTEAPKYTSSRNLATADCIVVCRDRFFFFVLSDRNERVHWQTTSRQRELARRERIISICACKVTTPGVVT